MNAALHQFAHDLFDALNARDVERVLAFYNADCEEVDVAQAQPLRGKDTVRRKLLAYWRAFPDMRFTLDDVVPDTDKLALVWHWDGTQRGTIMNIPPTGRAVTARGVSVLTLREGRISHITRIWDLAGLLRHLGLLTEL